MYIYIYVYIYICIYIYIHTYIHRYVYTHRVNPRAGLGHAHRRYIWLIPAGQMTGSDFSGEPETSHANRHEYTPFLVVCIYWIAQATHSYLLAR